MKFAIATAKTSGAATWTNRKYTWEQFLELISAPKRTAETIAEYLEWSKTKEGRARQAVVKDVGGFVGGFLEGGRRKRGTVKYRQLVCLDVDHATTLDAWLEVQDLGFLAAMYTTHKHTRSAPRYRIIVPLDRPVSPDEYQGIARTIASWLGMADFDPTTFEPTRLMYWPSAAVDGEFLHDVTDAPMLRADAIIEPDPNKWPRHPDEMEFRAVADKAEDPTTKPGIIGAFCRSYYIADAIEHFLHDVYAPCEGGRYTYVDGTTAGGLVVYDEVFAYSHHSTDPAGGKLCNAFDLVRLHKFGHLDEGKEGDVTRMPSYKAMNAFAAELSVVKREIISERLSSSDYDDETVEAIKKGTAADWVGRLELEPGGKSAKNTIANVVLILNNDEALRGRFGFNEFECREVALSALPWDRKGLKYPRPLKDVDDAQLRLYLERVYNITGRGQIFDGAMVVTWDNGFNPVLEYLDALEWDGTARLDTLLIDVFGADDTPYTRAVTSKAFIAAVARAYAPGTKFDTVLTIVGEQGKGKSTLLARMGREWFSDSLVKIDGREGMEAIQGSWIIELGEMASLRKSEVEQSRHFISKTEDRFRVAYGRRIEHFPRRCVFFGNTNEEDFLRDSSGNRRYWVVNIMGRTGRTNVWEHLTPSTVAQLWAEAKERYQAGETLYLPESLERAAGAIQDAHLERDDRQGLVLEYLGRKLPAKWDVMDLPARREWLAYPENRGETVREYVCAIEIWAECFGNDPNKISRSDSYAIGRMLKALRDCTPCGPRRFHIYGLQRAYSCNTL